MSTIILCLFSSAYRCNNALQIGGFGDIQQNGMVFGLSANFDQAEGAVGVKGGRGEHLEEVLLADVIGAGAGDEDTAGTEHLEGAEIEFLVAAEGGVEITLALGEGRWVEDDGVVVASFVRTSGGGVVLQEVEGVGLDPFDFFSVQKLSD